MPDPAESPEFQTDIVTLVEGWLRSEPELGLSGVRRYAEKLGLTVRRREYDESRQRIGLTLGPPRVTPSRRDDGAETDSSMTTNTPPQSSSPLMNWLTTFLTANPNATFHETRDLARAQGLTMERPIAYGRARLALGLPPMRKRPLPKNPRARRDTPSADLNSVASGSAQRGPGRRRVGGVDLSNLSTLVRQLEDVVDERDRYHAALSAIARILRETL